MSKLKRRSRRLCLAVAGLGAALGLFWLALGLFPDPLAEGEGRWNWSVRVTDREGRLLKEFPSPQMARRAARPLGDFSPRLLAAVLAAEDKRFYAHPGFDPLAFLRAAGQNLKAGRIKSGGSTITMQLARLNRGLSPGPRTFGRKFKEIWWALLIERHRSKERILAEYLNLAPCGQLTEGFQAAASVYLGKSVRELSWAESAFLAALPASPGALDPFKDPRPALARRTLILKRLAAAGHLTAQELARAEAEPLALSRGDRPFLAPHFVSLLRRNFGPSPPPVLTSSLDLALQLQAEEIVRETVESFRPLGLRQAAALVIALPSRQALAWVGSADFFEADEGQNDGVLARRQPGSALKPFLYAEAFDSGLLHPASLLADEAADYLAGSGSFRPGNYDGALHGSVSARLALASSLNIPAVRLAAAVGLPVFLKRLQELGLNSLDQPPQLYGLALPLGGGETTLKELTLAYAALADGGRWRPLSLTAGPAADAEPPRVIFSPGAAFLISDILSDPLARLTGFGERNVLNAPYPVAVKTGTSQSFRDNWCLGYANGFVVGVWAGNFQAQPMSGVSGVTGAGAIWRRISDLLAQKFPPAGFSPPPGVLTREVCPLSGLLAGPACPNRKREFFLAAQPPPAVCRHDELLAEQGPPVLGRQAGFRLLRPLSGEIYALDPGLKPADQHIKAQARLTPEIEELIWLLNGRELKRQTIEPGRPTASCLAPLERGPARLEVRGLRGGEVIEAGSAVFTVR